MCPAYDETLGISGPNKLRFVIQKRVKTGAEENPTTFHCHCTWPFFNFEGSGRANVRNSEIANICIIYEISKVSQIYSSKTIPTEH